MATLNIEDINSKSNIVRGSIGTLTGVTTSILWVDLGNPGAIFPFRNRLGGTSSLSVSFEGTFNMTAQILVSLQDTTPASTPCGASALQVPVLQSITGTTAVLSSIDQSIRWIGLNCSAFTSGSGTGWVYGVLPS
jgi:hypothetical protein